MSSEKKKQIKKYKLYIKWETEVKASNQESAILKGSENWEKSSPFLQVEELSDEQREADKTIKKRSYVLY